MTVSTLDRLHQAKERLAGRFPDISIRSPQRAPFLFVRHDGRSVEIYDGDDAWLVKCWDTDPDEHAPSVKTVQLGTIDQAVLEACARLGRDQA